MPVKAQPATVILIFASILWGLSWIPLKYLSKAGLHGLPLILLCYGAMSLMVLPFLWRSLSSVRNHLLPIFGIFVFGGLANLCFNYALIHGEVVRVMVLFYLLPVWGVLGGRFILQEKTDIWRWLGVLLAVGGAYIILGGNNVFSQPPQWMDLVALLSGLFFALNNLLFRAVQHVPLSVKLGALYLGCFVFAFLLMMLGVETISFASLNWQTVLLAIGYAIFWLFWANAGSQWAVTKMPAGRSSIIIVMELIAAVVSAIALGGEHLTPQVIIGGALVLSATFSEIFRAQEKSQAERV